MDRDIPDNHLELMRQMCSLPASEPLPEKLTKRYWALKFCLDRVQAPIQVNDMARLCVEAGFGVQTEREAKPDVATLFRKHQVKPGAEVVVNWREKKVKARLVSVNPRNECRVTFLEDGREETVRSDQVSLSAAA